MQSHEPWREEDFTWDRRSLAARRAPQGRDGAGQGLEDEEPCDDAGTDPMDEGQDHGNAGSPGDRDMCMVKGCPVDLSECKAYYRRFRICERHLKMLSLCIEGKPSRFCQQCGRFHVLEEFEGQKRSCRRALLTRFYKRRNLPVPPEALPAAPSENAVKAEPKDAAAKQAKSRMRSQASSEAGQQQQRRKRGRPRAPPMDVRDLSPDDPHPADDHSGAAHATAMDVSVKEEPNQETGGQTGRASPVHRGSLAHPTSEGTTHAARSSVDKAGGQPLAAHHAHQPAVNAHDPSHAPYLRRHPSYAPYEGGAASLDLMILQGMNAELAAAGAAPMPAADGAADSMAVDGGGAVVRQQVTHRQQAIAQLGGLARSQQHQYQLSAAGEAAGGSSSSGAADDGAGRGGAAAASGGAAGAGGTRVLQAMQQQQQAHGGGKDDEPSPFASVAPAVMAEAEAEGGLGSGTGLAGGPGPSNPALNRMQRHLLMLGGPQAEAVATACAGPGAGAWPGSGAGAAAGTGTGTSADGPNTSGHSAGRRPSSSALSSAGNSGPQGGAELQQLLALRLHSTGGPAAAAERLQMQAGGSECSLGRGIAGLDLSATRQGGQQQQQGQGQGQRRVLQQPISQLYAEQITALGSAHWGSEASGSKGSVAAAAAPAAGLRASDVGAPSAAVVDPLELELMTIAAESLSNDQDLPPYVLGLLNQPQQPQLRAASLTMPARPYAGLLGGSTTYEALLSMRPNSAANGGAGSSSGLGLPPYVQLQQLQQQHGLCAAGGGAGVAGSGRELLGGSPSTLDGSAAGGIGGGPVLSMLSQQMQQHAQRQQAQQQHSQSMQQRSSPESEGRYTGSRASPIGPSSHLLGCQMMDVGEAGGGGSAGGVGRVQMEAAAAQGSGLLAYGTPAHQQQAQQQLQYLLQSRQQQAQQHMFGGDALGRVLGGAAGLNGGGVDYGNGAGSAGGQQLGEESQMWPQQQQQQQQGMGGFGTMGVNNGHGRDASLSAAAQSLMAQGGQRLQYQGPGALLERMSIKLHNRRPDQLPADMALQLQQWLAAASASVLQGFIRPGCTNLILDVLYADRQRLLASIDRRSADPWVVGQEVARTVLGLTGLEPRESMHVQLGDALMLIDGRNVQLYHRDGGAHQQPGEASGGDASGMGAASEPWGRSGTWSGPELLGVAPLAIVAGADSTLELVGRRLQGRRGVTFHVRFRGRHLDVMEELDEGDDGSESSAAHGLASGSVSLAGRSSTDSYSHGGAAHRGRATPPEPSLQAWALPCRADCGGAGAGGGAGNGAPGSRALAGLIGRGSASSALSCCDVDPSVGRPSSCSSADGAPTPPAGRREGGGGHPHATLTPATASGTGTGCTTPGHSGDHPVSSRALSIDGSVSSCSVVTNATDLVVLFVEPAPRAGLAVVEVEAPADGADGRHSRAHPMGALAGGGGGAGGNSRALAGLPQGAYGSMTAAGSSVYGSTGSGMGSRTGPSTGTGSSGVSGGGAVGPAGGGGVGSVLSDWWPVVVLPAGADAAAEELNTMLDEPQACSEWVRHLLTDFGLVLEAMDPDPEEERQAQHAAQHAQRDAAPAQQQQLSGDGGAWAANAGGVDSAGYGAGLSQSSFTSGITWGSQATQPLTNDMCSTAVTPQPRTPSDLSSETVAMRGYGATGAPGGGRVLLSMLPEELEAAVRRLSTLELSPVSESASPVIVSQPSSGPAAVAAAGSTAATGLAHGGSSSSCRAACPPEPDVGAAPPGAAAGEGGVPGGEPAAPSPTPGGRVRATPHSVASTGALGSPRTNLGGSGNTEPAPLEAAMAVEEELCHMPLSDPGSNTIRYLAATDPDTAARMAAHAVAVTTAAVAAMNAGVAANTGGSSASSVVRGGAQPGSEVASPGSGHSGRGGKGSSAWEASAAEASAVDGASSSPLPMTTTSTARMLGTELRTLNLAVAAAAVAAAGITGPAALEAALSPSAPAPAAFGSSYTELASLELDEAADSVLFGLRPTSGTDASGRSFALTGTGPCTEAGSDPIVRDMISAALRAGRAADADEAGSYDVLPAGADVGAARVTSLAAAAARAGAAAAAAPAHAQHAVAPGARAARGAGAQPGRMAAAQSTLGGEEAPPPPLLREPEMKAKARALLVFFLNRGLRHCCRLLLSYLLRTTPALAAAPLAASAAPAPAGAAPPPETERPAGAVLAELDACVRQESGGLGLLHHAVRSGSPQLVAVLVRLGAALGAPLNPAEPGPYGVTPLHMAALLPEDVGLQMEQLLLQPQPQLPRAGVAQAQQSAAAAAADPCPAPPVALALPAAPEQPAVQGAAAVQASGVEVAAAAEAAPPEVAERPDGSVAVPQPLPPGAAPDVMGADSSPLPEGRAGSTIALLGEELERLLLERDVQGGALAAFPAAATGLSRAGSAPGPLPFSALGLLPLAFAPAVPGAAAKARPLLRGLAGKGKAGEEDEGGEGLREGERALDMEQRGAVAAAVVGAVVGAEGGAGPVMSIRAMMDARGSGSSCCSWSLSEACGSEHPSPRSGPSLAIAGAASAAAPAEQQQHALRQQQVGGAGGAYIAATVATAAAAVAWRGAGVGWLLPVAVVLLLVFVGLTSGRARCDAPGAGVATELGGQATAQACGAAACAE